METKKKKDKNCRKECKGHKFGEKSNAVFPNLY